MSQIQFRDSFDSDNKQLFFEIEVNSGKIFTEPPRGEVNILPSLIMMFYHLVTKFVFIS